MKILIVHSIYRNLHLSGENNVVEMQSAFLKTLNGVEVRIVNQQVTTNQMTLFEKLKTAFRVAGGWGNNPLKSAHGFNPNLIIVHNLFPNFGTRWLRKVGTPTILYTHNYRNFCASGNFFRNQKVCDLCIKKSPLQAIRYSCYKNSKFATLPLAIKQIREKSRGPRVSRLVRYICVSDPISNYVKESGIVIDSIATIPNFVSPVDSAATQNSTAMRTSNWVAVGRLVEEKGFGKLIENWPASSNLDLIGDGPDRTRIEKLIGDRSNVCVVGSLANFEIVQKLPTYFGAIIPSIWSEGSPLTEIEFRRAGLPVIQIARPGHPSENDKEMLIPYEAFMNNQAEKQLGNAINHVRLHRSRLSDESRQKFENEFSADAWLKQLNVHLKNWFGFFIE